MNQFTIRTIGYLKSEHCNPQDTPIQPRFAQECKGYVEIFPEFEKGLKDIETFSHIILLYYFNKAAKPELISKPFLEDTAHGVFATRLPSRPNAIGLSIVKLIDRKRNILNISGVDILNDTPVIDIKPYIPRFDCINDSGNGWLEKIDNETADQRGKRGYINKGNAQ